MKRKALKIKHIFFLFFTLLVLAFLIFCAGMVKATFFPEETSTNQANTIEIDWEKLYPHKSNENIVDNNKIKEKDNSVIDLLKNVYIENISTLSNYVELNSEKIPNTLVIKKAGVFTEKLFNSKKFFNQDDLQQISNGQIIRVETKKDADTYANMLVDDCSNLNQFLHKTDIPLFYVMSMVKYDESGEYTSYSRENRNIIVSKLKQNNINTLNMIDVADRDGVSVNDAFYKTDHHWKTSTGLWVANNIIDTIEQNTNLSFNNELLKDNNYKFVTYENSMFGSYGNTAGLHWTSPENHTVYYPKFYTKFHIEIPNKQIDNTGSFEDVLFNNKKIEEFSNGNAGYIYETTCYGNTPLIKIQNLNNKNAPKVLMIRDSYALATMPYLANVCSELDSIDVRTTNGNFYGCIYTYIEQFNPDIVLVMINEPIVNHIR